LTASSTLLTCFIVPPGVPDFEVDLTLVESRCQALVLKYLSRVKG